jgi:sugar phosphate permease
MPTWNELKVIVSDREFVWRWFITLGLCVIGYVSLIMCVSSLPTASPALVDDASLNLTRSLVGNLMALGSLAVVVGKLLNGTLADLLGGRFMYIVSVSGAGLSALAFGFGNSYAYFVATWMLLRYFHSAGWPSLAHIVVAWFDVAHYGRVWGIISLASRVGNALGALILGALLFSLSWRWVFRVAGTFAVLVGVALFFFLKRSPQVVGLPPPASKQVVVMDDEEEAGDKDDDDDEEEEEEEEESDDKMLIATSPTASTAANESGGGARERCIAFKEATLRWIRSPLFWLVAFGQFSVAASIEFGFSFLPLFFADVFSLKTGTASTLAAVYPIGSAISVVFAGYLWDALSAANRAIYFSVSLATAAVSIGLVWGITEWQQQGGDDDGTDHVALGFTVFLLLVNALSLSPAYYILMSVFATNFGKQPGLLISVLDVFGYAGAIIVGSLGASVVDSHGWSYYFPIFSIPTHVIGQLLFSVYLVVEAKHPRH